MVDLYCTQNIGEEKKLQLKPFQREVLLFPIPKIL